MKLYSVIEITNWALRNVFAKFIKLTLTFAEMSEFCSNKFFYLYHRFISVRICIFPILNNLLEKFGLSS